MDIDGTHDIVHPEVRAHINSLVSALGGVSTDDDGRYQLGDDALEVLRDIKRWIRFYDEKTNRMDVARCLYESNIVDGDILPILALWPESEMESKFKSRLALGCLEILVPLTWPMEGDKERMTVNHHRHMPVLEIAQVKYKSSIINYDGGRMLHTAIRVALPAMAVPIGDRSVRDQGLIKLVLFFLRNVAMIAPSPDARYDGEDTWVDRSATVDAFSYQDVLIMLLTLASNLGEDFRTEDTTVMEIIYHLIKRVDVEKLYMDEKQLSSAKASELSAAMSKESAMLRSYNRKGPTRHSRFGTMVWVKGENGKMTSLSGQQALKGRQMQHQMIEDSKKWKPPRRKIKDTPTDRELGQPPKLNTRARTQLREFVNEFLDSGFNPLFMHVRKSIDREAGHVVEYHRRQFFYVVAWFLEAERARRRQRRNAKQGKDDVTSFNLVAGVLNQEMFITLNKGLHESYERKEWHELTAVMRCFTQILLTVQEMTESGNEEDQEIAENVLSRLFYEEATHDAISNIINKYKDAQGFDFLDAATELVHHFLRILEAYSKQNVDMQVRSRKRTRSKKKKAASGSAATAEPNGGDDNDDDEGDSGDDLQQSLIASKERKFDFHRFSHRFTTQGAVNTFHKFLKFYQDLNDAQLKRCHRYFYRVGFKLDMSVMLFRLDIILLFYKLVRGQAPLDKDSCTVYKDWAELVKQILRKLFKKIKERPEMLVELLFSKGPKTVFYLQNGYRKPTYADQAKTRPAPEMDFRKANMERDEKVGVVVGALLDRSEGDHLQWFKKVLQAAQSERKAWEAAEEAKRTEADPFAEEEAPAEPSAAPYIIIKPDDDSRKKAMFKNPRLRLLLTVAECTRQEPSGEDTIDSLWIFPSALSSDHLKDTLHYIQQAEFNPPTFADGEPAERQLKRKSLARKRVAYDDDDDDDGADDGAGLNDEVLFPAGGPTARKVVDPEKRKKQSARKRRKIDDGDDGDGVMDEEELNEKRKKRRDKELEKARRIKSALYVAEGDDEFDEEEDRAFFARERALAEKARQAAEAAGPEMLWREKKKKKKETEKSKKRVVLSDDSDEEGGEGGSESDAEDGDGDVDMFEASLQLADMAAEAEQAEEAEGGEEAKKAEEEDDDEDEDAPLLTRRPRARGGFIMDSDDDDE